MRVKTISQDNLVPRAFPFSVGDTREERKGPGKEVKNKKTQTNLTRLKRLLGIGKNDLRL